MRGKIRENSLINSQKTIREKNPEKNSRKKFAEKNPEKIPENFRDKNSV